MTPEEKNLADVKRLATAEHELDDRLEDVHRRLTEARPAVGEAVLAATLAGEGVADEQEARQVDRLRAEAEAVSDAIDAARRKRERAIPAVWTAKAAATRAESAKLAADADKRQARTDRLTNLLRDHEGVSFAPPYYPPAGPMSAGLEDAYVTPRTVVMRRRAGTLAVKARELEGQQVRRHGTLDAPDLDGLLAQIKADPMVIGPRLDSVREWASAALQRVESWRGIAGLHLVWSEGTIDERAGRVIAAQGPVERYPGDEPFAPLRTVPSLASMQAEMCGRAVV